MDDAQELCDMCGKPLPDKRERYILFDYPDLEFCSEYCAGQLAAYQQWDDILIYISEREIGPFGVIWGRANRDGYTTWMLEQEVPTEERERIIPHDGYFVVGAVAEIKARIKREFPQLMGSYEPQRPLAH